MRKIRITWSLSECILTACCGGRRWAWCLLRIILRSVFHTQWRGSVSEVEKLNRDSREFKMECRLIQLTSVTNELHKCLRRWAWRKVDFNNFDKRFMGKDPKNCAQTSDSSKCVSHGSQDISPKYVWMTKWKWYKRRKVAGTALTEWSGYVTSTNRYLKNVLSDKMHWKGPIISVVPFPNI